MTEEVKQVKRGRGRPKVLDNPISFTFELEQGQKAALRMLAKDAGMSLGEMMRDIAKDFIDEWKDMRPDLFVTQGEEPNEV